MLRQVTGGVHVDVLLVRHYADKLLLPRPAWVSGDNLHAREVSCQCIEMNRPPAIQANSLATFLIGSQDRKPGVKHDRLLSRFEDFPQSVMLSIVRIEILVRWMEFKTFDRGIF